MRARRLSNEFDSGFGLMIAFVNVILLLIVFFILTSSFMFPGTLTVKIPHALTSDLAAEEIIIISISGENIIYFNDKVVSLNILKQMLSKKGNPNRAVLIKASQRASVGRIVELWDLCKSLGIHQIQIATTREK